MSRVVYVIEQRMKRPAGKEHEWEPFDVHTGELLAGIMLDAHREERGGWEFRLVRYVPEVPT